ncbi:DUF692 domain-containing protein [Azospirillum griseum]|uniref:UPF0276 protein EJ903_24870 n=1 Tax=Azospirillum griseum TaxID=2496639 RepID=A0A431VA37_9PROT|nr:DUF692 domain-containing protein [Azospirillum griseum]RTR13103.1 DUF692 domain-containing protein [Azospirillum griseum]
MTTPSISRPADAPIPADAGIGLRFAHHRAVLAEKPAVGWLEVHSENYMGGGVPPACLDAIRRDYPVSLHGVGLSLGSAEELDDGHLDRLCRLIDRIDPGLISEHLSWSIVGGVYLADLCPLPLTEEALAVVCRNIGRAQDRLGRRLLIENPSSYLRYRHSTIPEWEFLAAVASRTGCGLLCDVNNIAVSAANHGWDSHRYLAALPADSVGEFHLAGHTRRVFDDGREIRIDDHGSRVAADVWHLFEAAVALIGPRPTLIEWDTNVPPLAVLVEEAAAARLILNAARTSKTDREADHADAA